MKVFLGQISGMLTTLAGFLYGKGDYSMACLLFALGILAVIMGYLLHE